MEKLPSLLMWPLPVISTFTININVFLEFHVDTKPGFYDLDIKDPNKEKHRILSGEELVEYYLELIQKYHSKMLSINNLLNYVLYM